MLNSVQLARVDLNLLVLFDAVLAERHVARAATRLHLTPSAVSHGLGRLRRLMNDPLFVRHPRGVAPTEQALRLAPAVADVLARAGALLSAAAPFDPASSARRFLIGAPEAAAAVILPSLIARVRRSAPAIDLGYRNIVGRFDAALELLDRRELDVALVPFGDPPARFEGRPLYPEEFVLVTKRGHALGQSPTLAQYCAAEHIVISETGQRHGHIDELLVRRGRTRRVALAVPSFLLALAVVECSELVAALPARFVALHRRHFRVVVARPPLPLTSDPIRALVPRAALADAGLAWLLGELETACAELPKLPGAAPRRRSPFSAPRPPRSGGPGR